MTSLGLGRGEPPHEVSGQFRTGWVRHFKVAVSSAGGMAVVLAGFELLQRQPTEGFKLLAQWGPWPIIAIVALGFVGTFLSKMNDTVQTSFGAIVASADRQAQATGEMAKAVSRLADQGSRQAEEVRRLAVYAAREFPAVYERFDQLDNSISDRFVKLSGEIGDLKSGLQGLHWAVNVKRAEGESTNERGT